MALAPKRGQKALPATANFAALVAALGPNARNVRYDGGVLRVDGVTDAEIEDALASVDLHHATRMAVKAAAGQQLMTRIAAGMPWEGHPLQIDEASTTRITSAAVAADLGALPPGFAWRMADNTSLPMDEAGMIEMATAAFNYIFALRARYWAIVDAATDASEADLATIDPTTGWPSPPA